MSTPVEPRREDYLDDESFELADEEYWRWYDAMESRRKDPFYD